MSLNPLNELKRRLDDSTIPLPKRICLARNVLQIQNFPTGSKERVVGEWLSVISKKGHVTHDELLDVLSWLKVVDNLTHELTSKIIEMVAHYVEFTVLQEDDIDSIQLFLENTQIVHQLSDHITEFLLISKFLLQHLSQDLAKGDNLRKCKRILENYTKYYKESKRRLEFVLKFIEGDNLETIFDCFDKENSLKHTALDVCRNILFPQTKKSFYSIYLQTLIRKENTAELMQEKGDNMQTVSKVLSVFFSFPSGRTMNDHVFLEKYIKMFISCYKSEYQLIFAFLVMAINTLNMEQNYFVPITQIKAIVFEENDEKIKRSLLLSILEILLENDVNLNVRLTDTLGEKPSKVETKKNMSSFLRKVLLNQIKLKGKCDKTTLQIVMTALKLDPALIEPKLHEILPPLMLMRKNKTDVFDTYKDMLNHIIEMFFKLSRGTLFFNQLLPHLKLFLDARNSLDLDSSESFNEDRKRSKIMNGEDIFPSSCVDKYGQLTSELMFRQISELLVLLKTNFEEYCLCSLDGDDVSLSTIILTEVTASILCSFFQHCKMADHTAPEHISEDFWKQFQTFEVDVLRKFGECILKLNYNTRLTHSFLKMCLGYGQLKILNVQYSNFKIDLESYETNAVTDLSSLLPFFGSDQWERVSERCADAKCKDLYDALLILKLMFLNVSKNYAMGGDDGSPTKSYLIENMAVDSDTIESNEYYFSDVLLSNLSHHQIKLYSRNILKICLQKPEAFLLKDESIQNSKRILSGLVMEILKNVLKSLERSNLSPSLSKAVTNSSFDLSEFLKEIDIKDYFCSLIQKLELEDDLVWTISNYLEFLGQLQVYNLQEDVQLTTVLVLLALKESVDKKKLKRHIDTLLQTIFEVGKPDIYKIFPVDHIFSFSDNTLLALLTIKNKSSNRLSLVKMILEKAVKKVKKDSEIMKRLVHILLANLKNKDRSSVEYFSNNVFQLICIILPIIIKERRAINNSALRTVLIESQEKLHKCLLKSFKSIDFSNENSLFLNESGNIDQSTISDSTMATLNAMDAYSLTLSKYCESNDEDEMRKIDCLWSGLEYFVQNALLSIKNIDSKQQHVESSIQLINIILRHIKKIESHHATFALDRDKTFLQIWLSVKERLTIHFEDAQRLSDSCLENIGVTLKFVCELSSLENFEENFLSDLAYLAVLNEPDSLKSDNALTSHRVGRLMWTFIMKSVYVVGPKCLALSKTMHSITKNLTLWLQKHYVHRPRGKVTDTSMDFQENIGKSENVPITIGKMDDYVCSILVEDLIAFSEVVLAGRRVILHFKFMEVIFELQHVIYRIIESFDLTFESFIRLYQSSLSIINNMMLSRKEILEDRWQSFMQCHGCLVRILCEKSSSEKQQDKQEEEKLAEIGLSVEKITQSICKQKTQVNHLAAYSVASLCASIETSVPNRLVRQHLENCVAALIEASDSNHSAAFLRRGLAGSPGHTTMSNLYTIYKRYHKYVGNA